MPHRSIPFTRIGQSPNTASLGLAFLGFLAFLPAPANAQSRAGGADRVGPYDSHPSQKIGSPRNEKSFAWLTRFSKAGRDIGYLVVPGSRSFVSLGVAAGFETAIYYNNIRPHPTQCQPPALDKWQHCYVGCEISSWYPVGSLSASLLAILKEIRDVMGHGKFDWDDVRATLEGTWDCPVGESCEEFCCEQFG